MTVADMLIVSERSNTESILINHENPSAILSFLRVEWPPVGVDVGGWLPWGWPTCMVFARLHNIILCLERLNISLANCISRTFTFYLPGNCKIVKMINAKRKLPKICQDYRDIAHRQDYRDKKTTSVEVPNDNHSVESYINGLSHGLHKIPVIKDLCTTQDNHLKVPLAVTPGSGFVQSRLSQRLMDYQYHEVSELTM